jgi:hypothetical protein
MTIVNEDHRRIEGHRRSRPLETTMKRKLVASGLLAGLVAGTGAGFVLEQSGFAGASSGVAAVAVDDSSSTDPSTTITTDSATTDSATTDSRPDPGQRVRDVLQPLVDDGTLTSDQLEAVVSALDAAGPMGPGGRMGGPGGHMGDHRGTGLDIEAAATALGMTTDELRTELEGGSTIADVATAKGVDVQTVIDAIVADATARIDERVTAGDLTQDEADARIADLTQHVTDLVNNGRPERPGPPADPGAASGAGAAA